VPLFGQFQKEWSRKLGLKKNRNCEFRLLGQALSAYASCLLITSAARDNRRAPGAVQ
jgi:hypothetical protein